MLQALEERVTELEEENEYFRKALNLPPSTRPPLGRGPTGKDQPYHDADRSRRQTISPSGGSSAGSPSSYASSPELGPSMIAPSISSRTMTMIDAGSSSHWSDPMVVNERTSLSHSQTEQGHSLGQPIPILAPMPFKAPNSPNYSERIPPPLHSPSSAIYPQKTPTSYSPTSERSIESNFDSREPRMVRRDARNEVQHDFYGLSQNYQTSESNLHSDSLHTTGASMYPQSYHDPSPLHREWNSLPSDRVQTLRDHGFPENRRFPRPPEQAHPSHTVQHAHGYNRQPEIMNMTPPSRSQQYHDGRLHHIAG